MTRNSTPPGVRFPETCRDELRVEQVQRNLGRSTMENYMRKIMKMVVVEDNQRARRAMAAYMSLHAGIRITAEASNGLEAIRLIRGNPPDIVLLDVQMPIMNGLQTTKIIKKHWPQVKVIVLTMYPNYQPEAISAGADAFLLKGCSVEEMMTTIQNLFH